MLQLNLQNNEKVCVESEKVKYNDEFVGKAILTNLNIIMVKESTLFKPRSIIKIPLNDIKIVDNTLQVFYKKNKSNHYLHFYLKTHLLNLTFFKKNEPQLWLKALNDELIGKVKQEEIERKELEKIKQKQELQQQKEQKKLEKIQEKEEKKQQMKEQIQEKKEAFVGFTKNIIKKALPEKINFRCIACGYLNHGKIGQTIICTNCKHEQIVTEK